MCLSVPARVLCISGQSAEVEVYSERRLVYLAAEGARIGGWVLLHGGIAVCALDEETASQTLGLLKEFTAAQ